MNLADVSIGNDVEITDCRMEAEMKARMLALGLAPGQRLTVIRRGLGGDPIQIRIGATELMLRKNVASQIDVVEAPIR